MAAICNLGRRIRAGALGLICTTLGACSGSNVSPEYVPQGLLGNGGSAGGAVVLTVVDRINNSAPLPSAASGFVPIRYTAPGEQLVCKSCAYELETSPVELVRQFVSGALMRDGVSLHGDGSRRAEVQVLQFEFFEVKQNSGPNLHFEGRVGLRVLVSDHGIPIADKSYLESNVLRLGPVAFPGDIEEWVSRTASLSVENVLSDSGVSGALKGP